MESGVDLYVYYTDIEFPDVDIGIHFYIVGIVVFIKYLEGK